MTSGVSCARSHTVHACAPMCTSRNYPYFPHSREWNFLGSEGFCKTQKCKEMCEALFKFPEGLGVLEKISSVGEVWIFSGATHCMLVLNVSLLSGYISIGGNLKAKSNVI